MNKELASDNTEGTRDLRYTMRPLKEVWMQVGLEKVKNHEGVSVKALLNNGATEMFANRKFVEKNGFKLEKLERPVILATNYKQRRCQGRRDLGG